MIDLSFDNGTVEQFTLVLSQRDYTHLGQISNVEHLKFSGNLNAANEFSFEVHKYLDDHEEILWDDIYDLRLIWIKELNEYYEIRVELTDQVYKTKTITCTSLCECELSQSGLYDIEINTADDIARADYDPNYPTVFYRILPDPSDSEYIKKKNSSLLHRILDKVPAYSIAHVDSSLMNLQRTFSISNTTVYDFLTGECSDQFNCMFKFDSVNRTVSAYDLYTVCNNCGYRGDFNDVCPECGSNNLKYFGEDTTIFVSTENLTDEVKFETDVDSIKNAFRLEAGDDNMTAAVINSNPNGSRYIYEFSEEARRDMPTELIEKMDEYDASYNYYNNTYPMTINTATRTAYNTLVTKYNRRLCQVCGYNVGATATTCSRCGSSNIYKKNPPWSTVPETIVGYNNLIPYYYECVDLYSYLKSNMMPQVVIPQMTVLDAKQRIDAEFSQSGFIMGLSKITSSTVVATVNNAVVNYAKTLVNTGYVKITVDTDYTNSFTPGSTVSGVTSGVWRGRLKITNFEDDTDFTYSNYFSALNCNDAFANFMEQKITKQLSKNDAYAYDVLKLIAHPQTGITFAEVIKLYSAARLQSFHDAIEAVLGVLIDAKQGISGAELYTNFYLKYWNALQTCATELNLRNQEIDTVWGSYDSNGLSIKDGMIQYIAKFVTEIHKYLNFEEFVGEDLYKVFTTYIREQTYSNSNYISDGLDNNQLFDNARQFLERAKEELHKSATYQHSIKSNLNNLLAIDEFKPLLSKFELGNWIRIKADETVYRLRLIGYSIDFDSLQKINTEFSDVTITANGLNDIQSIIKQASSMASSYGYVEKQAESGQDVKTNYIDDWVQNGLNSALIRINNNNDEDISVDETGILARTYDDITEDYDPEQLRITHNVIAFTNNNWQTVATALGKFDMTYHAVNSNGINTNTTPTTETTYGLCAQAVLAGKVVGSIIEGGTIIGSHFQLPGNNAYIDMSNDASTTGKNYYINFGSTFNVDKNGKLTCTGASVSGAITANSGQIGAWNLTSTTDGAYGKGALYSGTPGAAAGALLSANGYKYNSAFAGAVSGTTWKAMFGTGFGITSTGALYASGATLSGSITATSGKIGAWNIEKDSGTTSDYSYGRGSIYYGTPSATSGYILAPYGTKSNYAYAGTTSRAWKVMLGKGFGIDNNGDVYIKGSITATSGTIGNWNIDPPSTTDTRGYLYSTKDSRSSYLSRGFIYLLSKYSNSWSQLQLDTIHAYYAVKGKNAAFYVTDDATNLSWDNDPENASNWVKISPEGITRDDEYHVPFSYHDGVNTGQSGVIIGGHVLVFENGICTHCD